VTTTFKILATGFVGFIPQSLVLRSVVLGWILINRHSSINLSIHALKACKRHEPCAKLFTEFSNLANNLRENSGQNLAKWSLNSVQIGNLNRTSACKTNSLFNQKFLFHLKWKLKEQFAKYQQELHSVRRTVVKTEGFLAQCKDVEVLCWKAFDASADEPCGIDRVCLDWWNLWLPRTGAETAQKSNVVSLFYPLETFRPNFIASFAFSRLAPFCILRIFNSETQAKREFRPVILYLLESLRKLNLNLNLRFFVLPQHQNESWRKLSAFVLVLR